MSLAVGRNHLHDFNLKTSEKLPSLQCSTSTMAHTHTQPRLTHWDGDDGTSIAVPLQVTREHLKTYQQDGWLTWHNGGQNPQSSPQDSQFPSALISSDFHIALKRFQSFCRIHILIYKETRPLPLSKNKNDLRKVTLGTLSPLQSSGGFRDIPLLLL